MARKSENEKGLVVPISLLIDAPNDQAAHSWDSLALHGPEDEPSTRL